MRTPFSKLVSSKGDEDAWNKQIKLSAINQALVDGSIIDQGAADQLRTATTNYIARWRKSLRRDPLDSEVDSKLTQMINDHSIRYGGLREMAVLACLHFFSAPTATQHLVLLQMRLESARYLRCLVAATVMARDLVTVEEVRAAQCLAHLLADPTNEFSAFQALVHSLSDINDSKLLPVTLIDAMVTAAGFRARCDSALRDLMSQRRLKTAYGLVSWLSQVPASPTTSTTVTILRRHFPSWECYSRWRPDYHRISLWESQSCLTPAQRVKLEHIFDLEGPDTTGQLLATFKMAEPNCYGRVLLKSKDAHSINQLLDIVDRAIPIGTQAVDLVIQYCIDSVPDEQALCTVEEAINSGSDSCRAILTLQQALDPTGDVSDRLEALIVTLPHLQGSITTDPLQAGRIATSIYQVMTGSQAIFCAQLERSSGEAFGMVIHELATATLQCTWLHSWLADAFVARLSRLPSRPDLENIFEQINAFENPYSRRSVPIDSRLKSYLRKTLGGEGDVDPGFLDAMQGELKFWGSHPDTERSDLAKLLSTIPSVGYELYGVCLSQMPKEDTLVIQDLTPSIRKACRGSPPSLARYLARRREIRQPVHDCWISLLICTIKEQGPSFFSDITDKVPATDLLQFIDDISVLVGIDNAALSESGIGLTRGTVQWWMTLSKKYRKAVELLSAAHRYDGKFKWLFVSPSPSVRTLLDICQDPDSMSNLSRQIVPYLQPDGSNLEPLCDCLMALRSATKLGEALCIRLVVRFHQRPRTWSSITQEALGRALINSAELPESDTTAIQSICTLIGLRLRVDQAALQSSYRNLHVAYEDLLDRARQLEKARRKLRHQNPERIAALMESIGVEEGRGGRLDSGSLPDSLTDAVETVGESEYEMCFPLTAVSDMQRTARGIPKSWRAVIIRISMRGTPHFCVHGEEGEMTKHQPWNSLQGPPDGAVCSVKPTLFTHVLSRNISMLASQPTFDLQFLYDNVAQLIKEPPQTCVVCFAPLGVKMWRPSCCSTPGCLVGMRRSPLEVRMHTLIADPQALDLLLTSAFAAAADPVALELFPGCPIQKQSVQAILNTFPAMTTLASSRDIRSTIRGSSTDGLAKSREDFLSWLSLSFGGFMMTAPDRFRIPSMPNTLQFVMLNSSHQREQAFATHAAGSNGGPVFHGTVPSRLFPILLEGLKVMSGQAGQLHGQAMGAGVYCGDDPNTSWGYSGQIATSWTNSTLTGMKIMLACELAGYAAAGNNVHLVNPHDRLLVRYVFLLPAAFQCPPRRHVDQALSTAFSRIRSGM